MCTNFDVNTTKTILIRFTKGLMKINSSIIFLIITLMGLIEMNAQALKTGSSKTLPSNVKKITIVQADKVSYKENQGYQVLKGNVVFEHDSTFMYCDSAHLNLKYNSFKAFSKIRVLKGDSITLIADTLYYLGNTKTADLFGNIVYKDRKMELKTPSLNYDLNTDIGKYSKGAVIKSAGDTNVLSSKIGTYESANQQLFFKDSVKLTNPEYVMKSDTLLYNVSSKMALFYGSTTIISEDNKIYCERGWYDTENEVSSLWKKAKIITKEQELSGDSIHYDRNKSVGKVYGNVFFKDTTNKIEGKGEYAYYNEKLDSLAISKSAQMTQFFEKDTLFLKAEFISVKNDTLTDQRTILSNGNVRVFKSDLQAKCDTLRYADQDSLMHFIGTPILWSDKNQITGNYIVAKTSKGKIEQMDVLKNAFIISAVDTVYYNQIKGKNLVALFVENKISKVTISGNSESMYYLNDEGDPVTEGNYAKSSNMIITFEEEEIGTIKFEVTPTAKLNDVEKMTESNLKLEGFSWQITSRPQRIEFLNFSNNE